MKLIDFKSYKTQATMKVILWVMLSIVTLSSCKSLLGIGGTDTPTVLQDNSAIIYNTTEKFLKEYFTFSPGDPTYVKRLAPFYPNSSFEITSDDLLALKGNQTVLSTKPINIERVDGLPNRYVVTAGVIADFKAKKTEKPKTANTGLGAPTSSPILEELNSIEAADGKEKEENNDGIKNFTASVNVEYDGENPPIVIGDPAIMSLNNNKAATSVDLGSRIYDNTTSKEIVDSVKTFIKAFFEGATPIDLKNYVVSDKKIQPLNGSMILQDEFMVMEATSLYGIADPENPEAPLANFKVATLIKAIEPQTNRKLAVQYILTIKKISDDKGYKYFIDSITNEPKLSE